jgi:hypothetical protein
MDGNKRERDGWTARIAEALRDLRVTSLRGVDRGRAAQGEPRESAPLTMRNNEAK